MNCGAIHEKFTDKPIYLENDEFITNILYQTKKFICLINICRKVILRLKNQ